MLTEKNMILNNQVHIHRLEKLYAENQRLFHEVVDFMPMMITISKVKGFSFTFVNHYCQEFINNERDYILDKGFEYTSRLVHPENLVYQKKQLAAFAQADSGAKLLSYFQYLKGEARKDYQWFLTYKKFLSRELYFSMSHNLSQLGKASVILSDFLGDLALTPHAYLRYQSLTNREKEILQFVSEGQTNEQIAGAKKKY